MMSMFFNRNAILPMWSVGALGIFTLLGPPLTLATGAPLLFLAIAPPAILLILSRPPSLTLSQVIADELRPAGRSRDQG